MRTVQFAAGVAALMLAAGCTSADEGAAAQGPPIAVSIGRAEVADLPSTFEAGGVIRARTTAAVASRLMAPITVVHVRPGDRVRRGDPLVTLDARDVAANRTAAAAALLAAEEAARAAESDSRASEANLRLAQATYDRMKSLADRESATAQELDQAINGLSTAEAQRSGALARRAAADATRDAARAGAQAAEVTASYGVLTAPFDGVVTARFADPGSMATPATPLLTMEDVGAFRLEARLDEARARHVTVGSMAEVRLDNDAEGWTSAPIIEMARVDPTTHSFLVKIGFPQRPDLRSGLFGRVRFAGPADRSLTVPESAVVTRGQLAFMYVVDAEQHARLRAVTTGAEAHGRVEVLAGARDGDVVVIRPPASLTDGARVTVQSGDLR